MTVLSEVQDARRGRHVLCRCDCGTVKEVRLAGMRRSKGKIISCGCYGREATKIAVSVGQVYGKYTVIREAARRKNSEGQYVIRAFLCVCECGVQKEVLLYSLRHHRSTSCGCDSRERAILARLTHGESKRTEQKSSATYNTWSGMVNRCTNVRNKDYKRYGARGIRVCDRWRKFENFKADMGERPVGTTIDRINNNGDYSPQNCRWATIKQQNRNTRVTRFLTYKGERRPLPEWAEIVGIKYVTLLGRLNVLHWSVEKALTTKVRAHVPSMT